MSSGWFRLSLRARFALASAVLVFAIAGLLGAVIGAYSVDQLRDRIGASLTSDAARIADRLNREMDARSRELTLMSALDTMRNLQDPEGVQGLLDTFRRNEPDYLWLAVTDLRGRVVAATDGSLLGDDLSNRFDIRDMLRGSPTRVDDPMRLAPQGQGDRPAMSRAMLNISRPIRAPDGTVVGVIVAQLSWDWIRELCNAMLTPSMWTAARIARPLSWPARTRSWSGRPAAPAPS